MLEDDLSELGIGKNEAKTYIALLGLGATTTGPIVKKSGLYRVMVYDSLQKLSELGLVSHSLHKNRKVFEAEDPEQILELVKTKHEVAKQIVEKLDAMKREKPAERGAFIYEGWRGIRAAQENYFKEMKSGEGEYLMVGASRELHKKLDAYFNYFHGRRSKLKVHAKLLFNENNRTFGNLKRKFKPVEVRFMPEDVVTPSWISTYKDMVLIGVAEDSPMAFFIKNGSVAKSYREYFYSMWAQGKK